MGAIKRFDPVRELPVSASLTRAKTLLWSGRHDITPRPLIEVIAEMPDFRSKLGQRHPLAAILALPGSAMRCGSRSYTAKSAPKSGVGTSRRCWRPSAIRSLVSCGGGLNRDSPRFVSDKNNSPCTDNSHTQPWGVALTKVRGATTLMPFCEGPFLAGACS
jgi:hypothetical protein